MKTNILLKESIVWQQHRQNSRYFYIEREEKIILLRVNNFPDEPLYTLIDGLYIIDIDDKPDNWLLQFI